MFVKVSEEGECSLFSVILLLLMVVEVYLVCVWISGQDAAGGGEGWGKVQPSKGLCPRSSRKDVPQGERLFNYACLRHQI